MPSSLVDAGFASWLASDSLFVFQEPSGVPAAIVATGIETSITSPLADQSAAQSEAARQLLLMGNGKPPVIDEHIVPGLHSSLLGQRVTIKADLYPSGQAAGLVIGAEEQDDGTSKLQLVVSADQYA